MDKIVIQYQATNGVLIVIETHLADTALYEYKKLTEAGFNPSDAGGFMSMFTPPNA